MRHPYPLASIALSLSGACRNSSISSSAFEFDKVWPSKSHCYLHEANTSALCHRGMLRIKTILFLP